MSRYYIGVAPRGNNVLVGVSQKYGGYAELIAEHGSVVALTVDFIDFISDDEIISSISFQVNNLQAVAAKTDTSVDLIITAPKGNGFVDLLVNFSSTLAWDDRIEVRNKVRYAEEYTSVGDYV